MDPIYPHRDVNLFQGPGHTGRFYEMTLPVILSSSLTILYFGRDLAESIRETAGTRNRRSTRGECFRESEFMSRCDRKSVLFLLYGPNARDGDLRGTKRR